MRGEACCASIRMLILVDQGDTAYAFMMFNEVFVGEFLSM